LPRQLPLHVGARDDLPDERAGDDDDDDDDDDDEHHDDDDSDGGDGDDDDDDAAPLLKMAVSFKPGGFGFHFPQPSPRARGLLAAGAR
jgi:hypothetical protein